MQDAAGRQQRSSPWLDGVVASWSCVKLRPATDDSPTDGSQDYPHQFVGDDHLFSSMRTPLLSLSLLILFDFYPE
jgi:hypothetical protein